MNSSNSSYDSLPLENWSESEKTDRGIFQFNLKIRNTISQHQSVEEKYCDRKDKRE